MNATGQRNTSTPDIALGRWHGEMCITAYRGAREFLQQWDADHHHLLGFQGNNIVDEDCSSFLPETAIAAVTAVRKAISHGFPVDDEEVLDSWADDIVPGDTLEPIKIIRTGNLHYLDNYR